MANRAYLTIRHDILSMVPRIGYSHVLDIGCAQGATVAALRRDLDVARVTGIEIDQESAIAAERVIERVLRADAQSALDVLVSEGERFDLVLCGDILEHLLDPWTALHSVRKLCSGYVVVSIPNVAHFSTLISLFQGRWPYRDRGIHDRTHLRFFSRKNLTELFAETAFYEERRYVRRRVIERPHPINKRLEPLLARLPIVRELTEYQYISLLR